MHRKCQMILYSRQSSVSNQSQLRTGAIQGNRTNFPQADTNSHYTMKPLQTTVLHVHRQPFSRLLHTHIYRTKGLGLWWWIYCMPCQIHSRTWSTHSVPLCRLLLYLEMAGGRIGWWVVSDGWGLGVESEAWEVSRWGVRQDEESGGWADWHLRNEMWGKGGQRRRRRRRRRSAGKEFRSAGHLYLLEWEPEPAGCQTGIWLPQCTSSHPPPQACAPGEEGENGTMRCRNYF